jgi:hypothetical protein
MGWDGAENGGSLAGYRDGDSIYLWGSTQAWGGSNLGVDYGERTPYQVRVNVDQEVGWSATLPDGISLIGSWHQHNVASVQLGNMLSAGGLMGESHLPGHIAPQVTAVCRSATRRFGFLSASL